MWVGDQRDRAVGGTPQLRVPPPWSRQGAPLLPVVTLAFLTAFISCVVPVAATETFSHVEVDAAGTLEPVLFLPHFFPSILARVSVYHRL